MLKQDYFVSDQSNMRNTKKRSLSRVVVKQLKPSCKYSLAFIIVRTTRQNTMYRRAPIISSTNWNISLNQNERLIYDFLFLKRNK